MANHMQVMLMKTYINDNFIDGINKLLNDHYGARSPYVFIGSRFLIEQAEYYNTDATGLTQLTDLKRPVTPQMLTRYYPVWYAPGLFTFRLSCCNVSDEAYNAIAVGKWIQRSGRRCLDKNQSFNYQPKVLYRYLSYPFEEAGLNLKEIWNTSKK